MRLPNSYSRTVEFNSYYNHPNRGLTQGVISLNCRSAKLVEVDTLATTLL